MEKTKNCIHCKEEKPLGDFYAHPRMSDGHLGKCKQCCKSLQVKRYHRLMDNEVWAASETKRNRLKSRKLRANGLGKSKKSFLQNKSYQSKYPEKYEARIMAQRIEPKVRGNHLHHWSYNKEHFSDVIELSVKEHYLLHRFIVYDQERKMYRRADSGVLLDTKERHIDFFKNIAPDID